MFPFLHVIDVLSLLFLCIYLALALSTPHLSNHSTGSALDCYISSCSPFYQIYQPIPHASVCQCLDSLPLPYFSKSYLHLASLTLTPKRHVNFILSLLLILAGDVELNPGPVFPPSNLSALTSNLSTFCLNVRSATSITHIIDKPALIQDFIFDKQADLLF